MIIQEVEQNKINRQQRSLEKEQRLEEMKLKAAREEEERVAQAEAHKQEILAG